MKTPTPDPIFNWLLHSLPSSHHIHLPPLSLQTQQWLAKYRIQYLFLVILCLELFMTLRLRPQYLEARGGQNFKPMLQVQVLLGKSLS